MAVFSTYLAIRKGNCKGSSKFGLEQRLIKLGIDPSPIVSFNINYYSEHID